MSIEISNDTVLGAFLDNTCSDNGQAATIHNGTCHELWLRVGSDAEQNDCQNGN